MNWFDRFSSWIVIGAVGAASLGAAEKIDGRPFAGFAADFDRVQVAAGLKDAEPAEVSAKKRAEMLQAADLVVAGSLPFYGSEKIKVGRTDIDWFGGQRDHQEWVAQLNRFRMLATLADAYELTGEAKYPERAQQLMEDFRRFVVEKHKKEFFDPQRNNRLNLSIRMVNWSLAIRRMGGHPSFTDRWVAEALDFMDWELDYLNRVTEPGMSNFQMAQADALILTSLYFPNLSGAAERLKHGAAVLDECLRKQFRPDGSHWENSAGYHSGMLRTAIKYRTMHRSYPAVPPGLPPEIFSGAVDFLYLASPWGFNDHALKEHFPKFKLDADSAKSRAEDAGLTDWRPPLYRAFPDAGVFFAGNADEHVMFDAAKVGSGHSHNSRLMALYAAYGEIMIADCGITTYEKSSPYYVGGRHTVNHATVNPDNLAQRRVDAKVEYWRIEPDFAVMSGLFDAGYLKWEQGSYGDRKPDFNGIHRRTVIWLADRSLLIFDRVSGRAGRWNYVFPVPRQDKIELDPAGCSFFTVNAARPNFRVRLLNPPGKTVEQKIYDGDAGKIYRGWLGTLTGGTPMPLLEFAVAGVEPDATALTRVSAVKAGEAAGDVEVVDRSSRYLAFRRPDGSADIWAFAAGGAKSPVAFRAKIAGSETAVTFSGEHLLIRLAPDGAIAKIFTDRGEKLTVGDRVLLDAPGRPFTGYLNL